MLKLRRINSSPAALKFWRSMIVPLVVFFIMNRPKEIPEVAPMAGMDIPVA
jgi:hypothetical protein